MRKSYATELIDMAYSSNNDGYVKEQSFDFPTVIIRIR